MSRNSVTKTKKRQSSAPRGSHYSEGNLYDDKTNQKLYFRTHVCTVFRETVAPNAAFNKIEAVKVMEKNLKKRQAHGTASILEDRFTIEKVKPTGKTPFRTWLFYKEIDDLERSRTKPEYFVLLVNSQVSGKRYYEVYKCKTKDDTAKFKDYIQKARANSDFMISEGAPLDVVPIPDPDRVRSMVHLEFQNSIDSTEDKDNRASMFQTTSPTPPSDADCDDDEPLRQPERPAIKADVQKPVRQAPTPPPVPIAEPVSFVHHAPSFTPPLSPQPLVGGDRVGQIVDLDNITYINYTRKRGAYACTNGPVYMYALREKNTYSPAYDDNKQAVRY